MILGAISPKSDKDRRSTLHPNSIKPLKDMGIEIFFERGLGEGIDVSDEEMQKNGAQPASREDCLSRSDVIFSSEPISSDEIATGFQIYAFLFEKNPRLCYWLHCLLN